MCNVEQLELQMKIIISFASYYLIVVHSPNWFESVLVQQTRERDLCVRKYQKLFPASMLFHKREEKIGLF